MFFLCSLLQSSLQILGQIDGLVEILSKVVSRHWPGQVAPWARWPGARQPPASSFSTLYYLPSGEFRNSPRLAAKILNPPKAPSINSSTLHGPSTGFGNSARSWRSAPGFGEGIKFKKSKFDKTLKNKYLQFVNFSVL